MNTKSCNGEGCDKVATLQCPNCVKLNVKEIISKSYFCSQDCFKKNWPKHKLIHNIEEKYEPWPFFGFTGKLRPSRLSPKRIVPSHIQKPDYAVTGVPASERLARGSNKIKILSPEEIQKMRTVCRMGREILDEASRAVKVGITTDEIDQIVHDETIKRNAYPSPLNYVGFPKSCCTSVNEVICHGIPDMRKLEDGDIVNIDVSVYYDGFHADLNETYFVGNVDQESIKLVNASRKSLEKAIEIVKPGVAYKDVGDEIQKVIDEEGLSIVRTYCGHGINNLFHAAPSVPHYGKNKAIGIMRPGHCFTIEPMISQGTYKDVLWPDDWTAVTADGKRSAQFEHTLLVTEKGVEVLTAPLPSSPSFSTWNLPPSSFPTA